MVSHCLSNVFAKMVFSKLIIGASASKIAINWFVLVVITESHNVNIPPTSLDFTFPIPIRGTSPVSLSPDISICLHHVFLESSFSTYHNLAMS